MVDEAVEVLAIIPARGGSKSIPRKNIKRLRGHPLIAYSIAAGLQASLVNRVIVSTEDSEIAEIARIYGAEVPFLRPLKLAQDQTPDFPVFEHALKWLEEHEGYKSDIIVQLRPTSPLRPHWCVNKAVSLLMQDPKADSVRAVTASDQNPYKMWHIKEGILVPLLQCEFPEPYNMPRQKLPQTFWQTGHIDAIRYETIIKKETLTGDRILPLMIDPGYAVDIDNQEHWEIAEWVLSRGELRLVKPDKTPYFFCDVLMVVFDFDGVFTDNKVYVLQDGNEAVVCDRSDGMGLSLLKQHGIEAVVLSREKNPVVLTRCKKLKVPCYQGIDNKGPFFQELVSKMGVSMAQVAFVGNDINDLECIHLAGMGIAVADAHPKVLKEADYVLNKPGGHGAVRELCDIIISGAKNGE